MKRCPFCGSRNLRRSSVSQIAWSVVCKQCGASGPLVAGTHGGFDSVERAWNRRWHWWLSIGEKLLGVWK